MEDRERRRRRAGTTTVGIAAALAIAADQVSVKIKSNEGVDAVGRGEAIAAHAIARVEPIAPQVTA